MRVVNESFKGRVRDLSCYRKRKQLDEKQILVPIVWCVRFQRFSSVLSGTILLRLAIVYPTCIKTKAFKMAALANESRYHLLEWLSRSR